MCFPTPTNAPCGSLQFLGPGYECPLARINTFPPGSNSLLRSIEYAFEIPEMHSDGRYQEPGARLWRAVGMLCIEHHTLFISATLHGRIFYAFTQFLLCFAI